MNIPLGDLIGKPYARDGRGPQAYDCLGLYRELCRRLGDPLPAVDSPDTLEERHAAIAAAIAGGQWRALEQPTPGCAVTFIIIPPYVSHIGMVLDGGRFIHVHRQAKVCIERLYDARWVQRIAGYYCHVGQQ